MEAQNNGDPYENLCNILGLITNHSSKTNAQVYRSATEAMRVWMATGSKLSFNEWLKCPATILSKTGK